MYQVGDLIIYGNHGVCKVEEVGSPEVLGIDKDRIYYTLAALYHNERIFTPVDTKVFMRPVITPDEAEQLITIIPSITESVYSNSNKRLMEDHYQEFMERYDCSDLIKLIKSVYTKKIMVVNQGKKLGQIDERFMRRAEDLLHGELAVALDIPKESVKDYIEHRVKELEPAYSVGN